MTKKSMTSRASSGERAQACNRGSACTELPRSPPAQDLNFGDSRLRARIDGKVILSEWSRGVGLITQFTKRQNMWGDV